MTQNQGITITLREIYDSVQEVGAGVRKLDERITKLEERTKQTEDMDDRSRRALQAATEAKDKADKLEQNQAWVVRTLVGALITGVVGVLFYLAQF